MTTGLVQEHNLEKNQMEKQIGCMAGFLQIFDRHQILAGKRIYSAKRLPPAGDSESESEQSSSPAVSKELGKPLKIKSAPSPDRSAKKLPRCDLRSPEVEKPAVTKSPPPLPVFEFKEGTKSSWKFSREAPRLSLDSRATVDAKGSLYPREIRTNAAILSANRAGTCGDGAVEEIEKQRRSTSVIARLMGLEPPSPADLQPEKQSELRRSASESRVSKDLFHSRFVDGNNFQFHPKPSKSSFDIEERVTSAKSIETTSFLRPEKAQNNRGLVQRKSFFDSQDIFPEPKQSVTIYGEIERRLKMRGIDEAPNDLETLKQILEALQLKGLLHSAKPPNQIPDRRRFSGNDSPIVIVTPARSPASANRNIHDSPPSSFRSRLGHGARRNLNNLTPEIDRNVGNQARTRSPTPIPANGGERGVKSSTGRKPLNIETQRRRNQSTDQRRLSPVHSPKLSPRRTVSDQPPTTRSPRYRKPVTDKAEISEESSSVSESSISTELQRSKTEEHKVKEGKSLLERCDQLLLSIAEITATELQPSPVSVLDTSSFYRDDSSSSWSPSPVAKRSIDFKELEIELDDDLCFPAIIDDDSEDSDFVYISEIFRVSGYLSSDSDVFQELEKQQFLKGIDSSKASRVQRKLIFDTIGEIIDRNRQLSTWKVVSNPNLQQTWSEFRRIRERDASEDLFEVICGVLRKDLAGDDVSGWVGRPIEMSEAVLDIERLVFKDLVGETIRELSSFGGNCSNVVPSLRRKLVF